MSFASTFVTGWTVQDEYAGWIPQGQTADQIWLGELLGSAGPGYGVGDGLVGPPSGDAFVVIDGTYASVPQAAASTRSSASRQTTKPG